jgi:putative nucleotidyltransferase with HDIG domain
MSTFYFINWRNIPHWFRLGIVAVFVIILSFFFPDTIQLDYQFEAGSTWNYEDLRAPFTFPILKSDSEIELEKKQVSREFLPIYSLKQEIKDQQSKSFQTQLAELKSKNDSLWNISANEWKKFEAIGTDLIQKIYTDHIIEQQIQKKSYNFVLIEKNTEVGEFQSDEFRTIKQAAQFVIDSLEKLNNIPYKSELGALIIQHISKADILFQKELTDKNKEQAIQNISKFRDKVNAGELIIKRGQLIDSSVYYKIISFSYKYEKEVNKYKNSYLIYGGYLIIVSILLGILVLFLFTFNKEVYDNIRHFTMVLVISGIFTYLSLLTETWTDTSLYLIPFCIMPIILKNFFNGSLALISYLVTILIITLLLKLDSGFVIIQLIAGLTAVISRKKIRYLSDFFIIVLYIGIAYFLSFLSLELLTKGIVNSVSDANQLIVEKGIDSSQFGWLLFNIILTLLSYPLIPLIEKGFGLISEITLIELSDLNKPLLKELSLKAPGTMQHSIQVANLAEAAANEINANGLLLKVGALYHDVGKTINPQFFIENQQISNPHEAVNYEQSAAIIIAHITEGIKMAKKNGLPEVLIDFIRTHHGTTRVEYFYRLQKAEDPNTAESHFTYPGPTPRTKEEVILMLADSVEAASKSLKNPTDMEIDQLVDQIVAHKINMKQLNDSKIDFSEINKIKTVFKKMLKSIYHVRIEYPE